MKKSKTALISLIFSGITAFSALAGLYLIYNAKNTLQETKGYDQGNLILNLNRDFFFNDKLTKIRTAFEYKNKLLTENGGTFSDVEMDDYIGFFDTISSLLDKHILEYDLVDQEYGYYIKQAYDNKEVQDYVVWVNHTYGK